MFFRVVRIESSRCARALDANLDAGDASSNMRQRGERVRARSFVDGVVEGGEDDDGVAARAERFDDAAREGTVRAVEHVEGAGEEDGDGRRRRKRFAVVGREESTRGLGGDPEDQGEREPDADKDALALHGDGGEVREASDGAALGVSLGRGKRGTARRVRLDIAIPVGRRGESNERWRARPREPSGAGGVALDPPPRVVRALNAISHACDARRRLRRGLPDGTPAGRRCSAVGRTSVANVDFVLGGCEESRERRAARNPIDARRTHPSSSVSSPRLEARGPGRGRSSSPARAPRG